MTREPSPTALYAARRYLLARPGMQPIYPMDGPSYKMSHQEAIEAVAYYAAVYGEKREVVDTGTEWCGATYPGNGSSCELPHGHTGVHEYHESRRSTTVYWMGDPA